MRKLFSQIISATLGLWIAATYISGVIVRNYPTSNLFGFSLQYQWEIFLILGITLGLINYFLRPFLKTLDSPLELITLGIFTIIINMGLIWLLDIMFDELTVPWLLPLLYTTLIIWGLNIILVFFLTKHN